MESFQKTPVNGYWMRPLMARFRWFCLGAREKDVIVQSKLDIREIDGHQPPMGTKPMLVVVSHFEPAFVQLEFAGKKCVVSGKELIKAVKSIIE
jgi:hypothetical protein